MDAYIIGTTSKAISSGGTINGDLTISGDLTVSGGGSLAFDEILEGAQVIDITNSEAFLVRKNGDGGDVFTINTSTVGATLLGALTIGSDGAGHDVVFNSGTSGDNFTWDASEECLIITGTDAAQALKVADGDLVVVDKIYLYDNDGGEYLHGSSDGHLEINAGTTLDITAPTVDLNSATEFNIDTAAYDLNASGAVTIDSAGVSIDSSSASNLTTSSGALTITSAAAATWSTAAGNLTLDSAAGSLVLDGHTGAQVISSNSGEVDITSAANVDINATTTVTVDGTGVSIDGTDDSNLTVTGSNKDLAVSVAGGSTQTLTISSAGTGTNAIDINATAGGVDIDANGAISLDSAAGSIDMNVVDGQTVAIGLNGAVETLWKPHGTAGNELWSTINTAGTTDGSDAAGSILLSAVAGGIGLAWADGKDLWAEGGRAVITANEDAADAIKLHADAGTSQTITIVNDAGTGAAAIGLTASAGGVTVGLGGGAGDDFIVDTTTLVVESDNNRVGIGTASPSDLLHIKSAASGHAGIIIDVTTDDYASGLYYYEAGSAKSGIIHYGDSTNGVEGGLQFLTGGVSASSNTQMVIDSSGNVGIGTNAPASPLHVYGETVDMVSIFSNQDYTQILFGDSEASNKCGGLGYRETDNNIYMQCYGDSYGDGLIIGDGGNVGIGAISPAQSLHVQDGNIAIMANSADAEDNTLIFYKSRNATDGSHTVVQDGDDLGRIAWLASDGNSWEDAAYILGEVDGTPGNSDMPGRIVFATSADGGASPAERMRITSAGNVGIGTASPLGDLTISNGGASGVEIQPEITTNTNRITNYNRDTSAYNNFRLDAARHEFLISGTERMRLDDNSRISLSNNDGGATSGVDSTTGNTIFGYLAGAAVDSDVINNTIFGHRAGNALNAGDGNVIIGSQTGDALTTGLNNTFIGREAGSTTTDVDLAVIVGYGAGNANMTSTADGTVCIGSVAGNAITSGAGNVLVGKDAGKLVTTGSGNTAVGNAALDAVVAGSHNTAVGYEALTTAAGNAAHNTAVGRSALKTWNVDGDGNNTAVGSEAGTALTTGVSNVLIGAEAGKTAQDVDGLVLVGDNAGKTLNHSNCDGTVAVGKDALTALTTGAGNIAIGNEAGDALTTESSNTLIGYMAGTTLTASDNTAIGANAMDASVDSTGCVAVGHDAMGNNSTGVDNCVAIGKEALLGVNHADADGCVAIGYQTLKTLDSGHGNIAVGYQAMSTHVDGDRNIAIGFQAMSDTNADSTVDGSVDNIFMGYRAGNGTWVTAASNYNVAIGNYSMDAAMNGALYNTAVGYDALTSLTTGDGNTCVGFQAGDAIDDGGNCTAIGYLALSADCGSDNTACGTYSLSATTGVDNTGIGAVAGYEVTSGDNNTFLGHDAGRSGSPGGAVSTGDNQVCIGDENITHAHIQVDWTIASDQRDKTDFTALDLGLDFVKELSPVTYRWDKRSKYGDKTADDYDLADQTPDGTHKEDWLDIGFKAQEVEALEKSAGYKIADKTNLTTSITGDGKQYGIQYSKFVPILVKAVQELSAKVEELEAKLK